MDEMEAKDWMYIQTLIQSIYAYMSVYVCVFQSICLYIYIYIYRKRVTLEIKRTANTPHTHIYMYIYIYIYIRMSFLYLSVCLSASLSLSLSIYIYICIWWLAEKFTGWKYHMLMSYILLTSVWQMGYMHCNTKISSMWPSRVSEL